MMDDCAIAEHWSREFLAQAAKTSEFGSRWIDACNERDKARKEVEYLRTENDRLHSLLRLLRNENGFTQ